jgi:hypothetical protein
MTRLQLWLSIVASLVVIGICAFIVLPALGDEAVVRDRHGQRRAVIKDLPDGKTIILDRDGRRMGTVERTTPREPVRDPLETIRKDRKR